jgi:hypothetical protein
MAILTRADQVRGVADFQAAPRTAAGGQEIVAVPRGPKEVGDINGLVPSLGENTTNDIQELSASLPKPLSLFSAPLQKPDLVIDPGDLPATARELRDLLAAGSASMFAPPSESAH